MSLINMRKCMLSDLAIFYSNDYLTKKCCIKFIKISANELEVARHQQIDISRFEENMNLFKEGFARNYRIASDKFKTAIEEIDKTISHLQKTKEALLSSENQLRLANNKAEDLSIKKLTKDAPTVKKMFDEVNSGRGE